MANTVVKSAADTNTQLDDATLNPSVTSTAATGNRKIVHVTLVMENLDLDPDDLYDALDAQWAVVAGEKEYQTRGCWIFNIGPA